MNLVDVFVVEIIDEPKQIITDEFCGWIIKVLTSCYGCKQERIFTSTTKKGIEKYIIGYSWME